MASGLDLDPGGVSRVWGRWNSIGTSEGSWETCLDALVHRVYLAQDLPDAELLWHKLLDHGIEAVVRNDQLLGILGEMPLTCRPEVCVLQESDIAAARALVEAMEAGRRAPDGEEVPCKNCGETNPSNFELCWQCRAEL